MPSPFRAALFAACCLSVLATSLSLAAATTDARRLPPGLRFQRYRLPNGLRVIPHPDRRVPTVQVAVSYAAGSAQDPPGRSGLAHLVEHVMFRGTRHLGSRDVLHILGGTDVHELGRTDRDGTLYTTTLSADDLALGLWLESSRMAFLLGQPGFERSVAIERDVVENERRLRLESEWQAALGEQAMALLYPAGHPYHRLVVGRREELATVTSSEVAAFYRRHHGPEDAILLVAGNFDERRARALIARLFGGLPPGPRRPMPAPVPVKLDGPIELQLEAPFPASTLLAWHAPAQFGERPSHKN